MLEANTQCDRGGDSEKGLVVQAFELLDRITLLIKEIH